MSVLSSVKSASWGRRFLWLGIVLAGLFVLIQLVPYGRDHANPPVQVQAKIAAPEARQLWADSCADCHRNLPKWPGYSNVAPVSWRLQSHVEGGREEMNISEWENAQPPIGEVREVIESGEMPTWDYALMHGGLSDAEKKVLIAGLTETYRNDPPGSIRQGD